MMNNGFNNSYNSIANGLTSTASFYSTSQPTAATNSQSQGLKTYFKTPEGRYKLRYEKTRPPGLAPSSPGKSVSKTTLAPVSDKPVHVSPVPSSSESTSASSGLRYAAAKLLGWGSGNGMRVLSFLGGNGTSKATNGTGRADSFGVTNGSHTIRNSNYDSKGTYLIFNSGDTVCIGDLNSPDKDPIKLIYLSNSNPACHAFDPEADAHDFLIGLNSGDIYSVSLRQQLQDIGKKLVGAQHYNRAGSANNSRCTCIAWVPNGDGTFVVAHADGNLYVYEKGKEGYVDSSFPIIRDQTQFSVSYARSSKSNPIARWHICQGSINGIAFSRDGTYLATVGRDGYLRVFDYSKEQLVCGGKSYYGALLCCSWSGDGKYILTGGEDDLVSVWSMEDLKVVAWGEGHNSWVSEVAFDPYWSSPASDDTEETSVYRFGSVGLDAQLLLWDLSMEDIIVPLRRCPPGGSPTFSSGNQSPHWKNNYPVGTLQPAPSIRDVPKLSPVVAQRVHQEALSGIIFTPESIITACGEGHLKIWIRPGNADTKSNSSESHLGSISKDQELAPGKVGAQASSK